MGGNKVGGWTRLLSGFCARLNRRRWDGVKKSVVGEEKQGWGYVDIIEINGTNYTNGKSRDLVYIDGEGNVLDLDLFRQ